LHESINTQTLSSEQDGAASSLGQQLSAVYSAELNFANAQSASRTHEPEEGRSQAKEKTDPDVTGSLAVPEAAMDGSSRSIIATGSESGQQHAQYAASGKRPSRAISAKRMLERHPEELVERPALLKSFLQRLVPDPTSKSHNTLSTAKSRLSDRQLPSNYADDSESSIHTGALEVSSRRAADHLGATVLADKVGRIDYSSGYTDFTDRCSNVSLLVMDLSRTWFESVDLFP
jgi:hypothetical protein